MDENFVREREKAVQAVKECGEEALLGGRLWHAVSLYEGTTFYTSKKLPFTYRIKGRELFCDRKEKSITEATVLRAYKKILEARAAGEPIRGPKKLSMFGAPYIWGILKGLGLAGGEETERMAEMPEDAADADRAAETPADAAGAKMTGPDDAKIASEL